MAEESLTLETNQDLGEIVIAPEVIEIIIGIAASKVEGVYSMRGSFASALSEAVGRQSHGKGIVLSEDEEGQLTVDIFTYLKYGVSVPKTAMEIQEKVKQQVIYMTGLDIQEVNVHVVAVIPEKLDEVDLTSLLDEEDEATHEN